MTNRFSYFTFLSAIQNVVKTQMHVSKTLTGSVHTIFVSCNLVLFHVCPFFHLLFHYHVLYSKTHNAYFKNSVVHFEPLIHFHISFLQSHDVMNFPPLFLSILHSRNETLQFYSFYTKSTLPLRLAPISKVGRQRQYFNGAQFSQFIWMTDYVKDFYGCICMHLLLTSV